MFAIPLLISALSLSAATFHSELRWQYQSLGKNCTNQQLIVRLDEQLEFSESFLLLRLDFPFLWYRCQQLFEVDEEGVVDGFIRKKRLVAHTIREHGLGDVLTKAIYTQLLGRWKVGFGSDFVFPTAQGKSIGTGKCQAVPTVDLRYSFAWNRFWICLLNKYEFSFAGQSKRPSIGIWFIQPKLEFSFPNRWAFSLDSEMQYNVKDHALFIPVNMNFSKGITERFFFSIDYKIGVVRDFPVFKQTIELACWRNW